MFLGIDLGTTGTMCIAFDAEMLPLAQSYRPLKSHHPAEGRVEQDPEEILATIIETVAETLPQIGGPDLVQAVGLDNQGESVLAWDSVTGCALSPVLVWSDRRAVDVMVRLQKEGLAAQIRALSGMELSDYHSAAKITWLLQCHDGVRQALREKRLRFGTLDSWVAHRLGGRPAVTDRSTASRTQLCGLASGEWDPVLLKIFGVPIETLAEIRPSLGDWGVLQHPSWGGALPWCASLVDQPAALAGNACLKPGEMKVSYGTGCFLVANAGTTVPPPADGLLTSVAWSKGLECIYARDGGVFTAGTAVQWLVSLGFAASAAATSHQAQTAGESLVRFLPAFTGLGAPWSDANARGVFSGLTAGTTAGHMVRAVLDSIAMRVRDIAEVLWKTGQPRPAALRVDGGLSKNEYLMQRQADILGLPIECGTTTEASAKGAAVLAGIAAGVLTWEQARASYVVSHRYEPQTDEGRRESDYAQWLDWLHRARGLGNDTISAK